MTAKQRNNLKEIRNKTRGSVESVSRATATPSPAPGEEDGAAAAAVAYRATPAKGENWDAQVLLSALAATEEGRKLLKNLTDTEFTSIIEEFNKIRKKRNVYEEVQNVLESNLTYILPSNDFAKARLAQLVSTKKTHPKTIQLETVQLFALDSRGDKTKTYTLDFSGKKQQNFSVYDFNMRAFRENIDKLKSICTPGTPYKLLTNNKMSNVEFKATGQNVTHVILHLYIQDSAENLLTAIMMLFSRGKILPRTVQLCVQTVRVTEYTKRRIIWLNSEFTKKILTFLQEYIYKVDASIDYTKSHSKLNQELEGCIYDAKYILQSVLDSGDIVMSYKTFRLNISSKNRYLFLEDLIDDRFNVLESNRASAESDKILVVCTEKPTDWIHLNRSDLCIVFYKNVMFTEEDAQFIKNNYHMINSSKMTRCITRVRVKDNLEYLKNNKVCMHLFDMILSSEKKVPLKKLG